MEAVTIHAAAESRGHEGSTAPAEHGFVFQQCLEVETKARPASRADRSSQMAPKGSVR